MPPSGFEKKVDDGKNSGPMFVLDCMGIDLSNSGVQVDMPHPHIALDLLHHIWAVSTEEFGSHPEDVDTIRGPPDEIVRASHETPLILTTQRFRI